MNTEEEYIPDSESVRQQRELHHQPQICTLSQCFQLYTKEEQVDTDCVLWLVHMQQRNSDVVQAALGFGNQYPLLPISRSLPQMMHGDAHTVSSCSRVASH